MSDLTTPQTEILNTLLSQQQILSDILYLADILDETNHEYAEKLRKFNKLDLLPSLDPQGLQAIVDLIKQNLNSEEQLDYIFNKLFVPPVIPRDVVENKLRIWHGEIYEEVSKKLALEIVDNRFASVLFNSCMFAGKSTVSEMICTILRNEHNFKTFTIVPHSFSDKNLMETPKVKVRGKVGEDGNDLEINAIPLVLQESLDNPKLTPIEKRGLEKCYWEKVVDDIISDCNGGRGVVHFDEFSFLPVEVANAIATKLKNAGINVLFAGLNKDYLGRPLPAFERIQNSSEFTHLHYECRSFVYEQQFFDQRPAPMGTKTQRHLNIGNKGEEFWVLDVFGAVPIPKENERAHYSTVTDSDHLSELLQNSQEEIRSILENPDTDFRRKFNDLLLKLFLAEKQERVNANQES